MGHGGAVGLNIALQAGKLWVQLPLVPLEFFIDVMAALWPLGQFSL